MARKIRTAGNAARVLAAGVGLLALLICVGIMIWMFGQTADTSTRASKKARRDLNEIKRQLQRQTEALRKAADERARRLNGPEAASQPTTRP